MVRKYRKMRDVRKEKSLNLYRKFTDELVRLSGDSLVTLFSKALRKAYNEKSQLIKFFVQNGRDYALLKSFDKTYNTKLLLTQEELLMLRELSVIFKDLLGSRNESETARRILYYYYVTTLKK